MTGVTAASPGGGHHCRAGPGTTPRRRRGGLNGPRGAQCGRRGRGGPRSVGAAPRCATRTPPVGSVPACPRSRPGAVPAGALLGRGVSRCQRRRTGRGTPQAGAGGAESSEGNPVPGKPLVRTACFRGCPGFCRRFSSSDSRWLASTADPAGLFSFLSIFRCFRASVFRGFPFVFCGAGSPWGELPPRYSEHPGKPLETPTGEVLPRMIRRHSTTRASSTEAPGGAGEPMTTGPGRGRCPHGGVSSFRSADARRWRSGPRPPPGDGRERPPRHWKAAGPRPLVRCRRSPAPV